MAAFSSIFDTQVVVYRQVGDGPAIGLDSKWADEPFPATNKEIDGFLFDQKKWNGVLDDNEVHFVPVLWDTSTAGVRSLVDLGIGDNNDLLVTQPNSQSINYENVWRPQVRHGFYYVDNDEYYLYSDDGVVDCPTASGIVASGIDGLTFQLSFEPKPGIPLTMRSYRFDRDEQAYVPDIEVTKKVEFTGQYTVSGQLLAQSGDVIFWDNVNTSEKEFTLTYNSSPPTLYTNQQIAEKIGDFYATTSGLNQAELDALDTVGIADGSDFQQLNLTYSPVDSGMDICIYSDYLGIEYKKYSIVDEFTVSGQDEVILDTDLGLVTFGTETEGGLPTPGSTFRASYYKIPCLEYEPINTRDYAEEVVADLNPIRRYSGNGFVHLRRSELEIDALELSAELAEISENYYGPLFLGNAFAVLNCLALAATGETIEGQEIEFEILGTQIGGFGSDNNVFAMTNAVGVASTLYNPPRTLDDISGVTTAVAPNGLGGSSLFIENYEPEATEPVSLFQVAREDLILGIPKTSLRPYYEDFLTLNDLTGPEITHNLDGDNIAWAGSAIADSIKWEVWHREVHGLAVPLTYEDGDLKTGKKTVLSKLDANAVNPHTGTTPAVVPVLSENVIVTTSGLTEIQFTETLQTPTDKTAHKSYVVAGAQKVQIRAKTVNEKTGKIIYSNTIEILIDLPDSARGLLDTSVLNATSTGVLGNAVLFDQDGTPLDPVVLTASGNVPLGWRLRSAGVSLASAIDRITFIDLNAIEQSWYDEELLASGVFATLGHEIEVI